MLFCDRPLLFFSAFLNWPSNLTNSEVNNSCVNRGSDATFHQVRSRLLNAKLRFHQMDIIQGLRSLVEPSQRLLPMELPNVKRWSCDTMAREQMKGIYWYTIPCSCSQFFLPSCNALRYCCLFFQCSDIGCWTKITCGGGTEAVVSFHGIWRRTAPWFYDWKGFHMFPSHVRKRRLRSAEN